MSRFWFSGTTLEGEPREGSAVADSADQLRERLLASGIFPDSVRPATGRFRQLYLRFFKRSEITRLLRQFQLLLASEITVLEALELVCEHTSDHTMGMVFHDVIAQVEKGRSLAAALSHYPSLFDELTRSMMEAGEASGELPFAIDTVACYRERYDQLIGKVRAALAYPVLVVIVAIAVTLALILAVVPVFGAMYENFGAELPELTQTVIMISEFLRNHISAILIAVSASLLLLLFSLTTERAQIWIGKVTWRLPFLGRLLRLLTTARFCRTMGALLSAGVNIIEAFSIAARSTGNIYVRERVIPAGTQLIEGKSLTETLAATSIFPRAMLRLSASGEKTGRLDKTLQRAADYYETQVESSFAVLTSLAEPLIILVLGVFIAFLLVAMYLPLFDLIGAL